MCCSSARRLPSRQAVGRAAELQGWLPIRVSLASLNQEDFRRILTEPEATSVKQYKALLATEKVELEFKPDAIDELAKLSAEINEAVENIGARRLHTVMEKLLEEISFTASDSPGRKVEIDAAYVREKVSALAKNADLSKFVLDTTPKRPQGAFEGGRRIHLRDAMRALVRMTVRLEAIRRDQVDQIRRPVQPPHHERHGDRGDHQRGGAPQSRGAPTLDHAGCGTAAGRESRSSTIGQCSKAETMPSAIEIHHIMS